MELLKHIDWPLLAEQKLALLEASAKDERLDGPIHFLDSFQDEAASLGYPVVWLGDEAA